MAIWRLHTKPSGCRATRYCLENGVAAVGWALYDLPQEERESITTFEDYETKAKVYADKKGNKYKNINVVWNLANAVRPDDLIWIRNDGKYYIGRVTKDSHWKFNAAIEERELDVSNQLTDIEWYPNNSKIADPIILDESSVPGKITTAFIQSRTLQRISSEAAEVFSKYIFNQLCGQNHYNINHTPQTAEQFFELLSPEDCEDLMAMWLYQEKSYICIPSTNKISTPTYEFVLIDPNEKDLNKRKHIYVQAKNRNEDLNAGEYANLPGEVYLLCTRGKITNIDKYDNIHVLDTESLYGFAKEKGPLIPEKIVHWIDFMEETE